MAHEVNRLGARQGDGHLVELVLLLARQIDLEFARRPGHAVSIAPREAGSGRVTVPGVTTVTSGGDSLPVPY